MIKKLFYRLTNKIKYLEYKAQITKKRRLSAFKNGLEDEISRIHNIIINNKEIAFLHSGHLGDIICSLPVYKNCQRLASAPCTLEQTNHYHMNIDF